jgi:CBS domain-containing protein
MPRRPAQELWIAVAGPLVNVVIAATLFVLLGPLHGFAAIGAVSLGSLALVQQLLAINIWLVVFNMLPAFPMDGGRVLRALLAIPMGYTRATRVAATIGQGLAFVFAFFGLMGNPLLILIAVFIFLAASGEAGYVQMREYTRGYLASHAMITAFKTLGPGATVDDAAALLLRTTQQEFPVIDNAGAMEGVLTREALIRALQDAGGATPVVEVMEREVPTVPENAHLDNIFQMLQGSGKRIVGVVDMRRQLTGYITAENLSELVMIQSSRANRKAAPATQRPAAI